MTSSSGVESCNMDDNDNDNDNHHQFRKADGKEQNNSNKRNKRNQDDDDDELMIEEGEVALWERFTDNFRQVQSVLDQNRVLIQQVNENHQSKLPDNLTKNVALIKEINGNISTVVSLYSNLSANFTNVFHHHHQHQRRGSNEEEEEENNNNKEQQQQQQSPEA